MPNNAPPPALLAALSDADLARLIAYQRVEHVTTWHECSTPGCSRGCRRSDFCDECLAAELKRRAETKR